ncbi:hypothetical protein [Thermotoga sp. SG1]|nr:hypothetical protein [Thermotoga sp. SG1]
MRFMEGLWRLREGVQVFSAKQIYEYFHDEKNLFFTYRSREW